jgi:hypothetical protein
MESFWSTLNAESVNHERYATREEACRSIFEYIEISPTGWFQRPAQVMADGYAGRM